MKTSVKFTFRESQSKSGMGTLVLCITRHRVTRSISTFNSVFYNEWDEKKQMAVPLKNSSPQREKELLAINAKLKKDLQLIRKVTDTLNAFGNYSSQDIVEHYRRQQQGQPFCEYINTNIVEKLNADGRFGTARSYRFAAVSFLKFCKGRDISLDKINSVLMNRYEHYLKTENRSMNTISCYMRSLRAAYNTAVSDKVFIPEKMRIKPFSGVFTGYAKTKKRAISAESIMQLKNVELRETPPQNPPAFHPLHFTRDLFLFSFYTQGMNFSDMANLKTDNIKEGIIRYNRKKTGQQISIELEDCMKEVIDRYLDSNSNYIFPILRNCNDCDESVRWKKTMDMLAIFNRNLNKLACLAGIRDHLTSYVARHSWASIASQEGIPIPTISRGMGHESEKTTLIYISQLDSSDVGRANKKILSRFAV